MDNRNIEQCQSAEHRSAYNIHESVRRSKILTMDKGILESVYDVLKQFNQKTISYIPRMFYGKKKEPEVKIRKSCSISQMKPQVNE